MLRFVRRKLTAVLVALALAAGLAPAMASAMPAGSEKAGMDMTMSMSEGGMHCDQQMPVPDHKTPCNDGATCLGMLGCVAPTALAPAAVAPVAALHFHSFWPPQLALNGLARQPALPPPIV
jgi:hypothetical protein